MAILEIDQLTMQFGGLTAVQRLDLRVEPGTIFALIGPNGAGKTTVFNAVTGIYEPTRGSIKIAGREPSRPLTWKVLVCCVLVGVLTALGAVLLSADVDRLWHAAIKRNLTGGRPFSYAAAWRDTGAYLQGDLAVEKLRQGRWAVVTADGKRTLDTVADEVEARRRKANLEEVLARGPSGVRIEEREGRWLVVAAEVPASGGAGRQVLAGHGSATEAQTQLDALAAVAQDQVSQRRRVWVALALGLLLGTAGAFAVWRRSRRTPDVIAHAGVARTFQNIRLFRNLTVQENVLVGLAPGGSRRSGPVSVSGVLRWALGRRKAMLDRAGALLDFVGLAGRAHLLADSLAYGDQRRLEIARALAAGPRLLLLDEPAAGMNPAEAAALMGLIRAIRDAGVTVLLIEHHMNVVMGISDRVAVLDHGVKIAEGTPAEVKRDARVIDAYLGREEVA